MCSSLVYILQYMVLCSLQCPMPDKLRTKRMQVFRWQIDMIPHPTTIVNSTECPNGWLDTELYTSAALLHIHPVCVYMRTCQWDSNKQPPVGPQRVNEPQLKSNVSRGQVFEFTQSHNTHVHRACPSQCPGLGLLH